MAVHKKHMMPGSKMPMKDSEMGMGGKMPMKPKGKMPPKKAMPKKGRKKGR